MADHSEDSRRGADDTSGKRTEYLHLVGKPSIGRNDAGDLTLKIDVLNRGPIDASAHVNISIDGTSIQLAEPTISVNAGSGPVSVEFEIPADGAFTEYSQVSVELTNQLGFGLGASVAGGSSVASGLTFKVGALFLLGLGVGSVTYVADLWEWPWSDQVTEATDDDGDTTEPTAQASFSGTYELVNAIVVGKDDEPPPIRVELTLADDPDCTSCDYDVNVFSPFEIASTSLSVGAQNAVRTNVTAEVPPFGWVCRDEATGAFKFEYDSVPNSTTIKLEVEPGSNGLKVDAHVVTEFTHDEDDSTGCPRSERISARYSTEKLEDDGTVEPSVEKEVEPPAEEIDSDGDGTPSTEDCNDADATVYPGATDTPGDGIDQDCDGSDAALAVSDKDSDKIADSLDNCPDEANFDQADYDGDGEGDACDADDDNDGLFDGDEAIHGTDPLNGDTDGDGVGDGSELESGANPLDPADDGQPPKPPPTGFSTLPSTRVDCDGPGQYCSHELFFKAISTSDGAPQTVRINVSTNHCSPTLFTVLVNGDEADVDVLNAGETAVLDVSALTEISFDPEFDIAIQATGIKGGCNSGDLHSWQLAVDLTGLLSIEPGMSVRPS